MVEAVGASPSPQASFGTEQSSATSLERASVESRLQQKEIKRIADAFECGEEAQDLLGFTGGGEREHEVAPGEHAQIAMDGFGGMEEERGRAGGGERSGDLLRDDAALAHAGDDDAASRLTAAKDQLDSSGEGRGHGAFEPRGEREEALRLGADEVCGRGGGIGWSGHDLFPASVRMTMAGAVGVPASSDRFYSTT